MIYKVKIEDRLYEVEITDPNVRPVLAIVDGLPIEVWPEAGEARAFPREAAPVPSPTIGSEDEQIQSLLAPMPGTITAVMVKPGVQVVRGQEICVLEAMKMKNSIRSPRAGIIGPVHVSVSQTVKFHDVLVEYQG
jgi:glutaconyl-CoA/methylmalonyl-CoA decarboxylase subunit gamma